MNTALVWFRQDLRLKDNPAFIWACNNHEVIIPLYIFDENACHIGSAKKWWLHNSLAALARSLEKKALKLVLKRGDSLFLIRKLVHNHAIKAICWNRCYEPATITRDSEIKTIMQQIGVTVKSFNGSLLNEPWKIKNKSGNHFKIYSSFWQECLRIMAPTEKLTATKLPRGLDIESDTLEEWKLLPTNPNWASEFAKYWKPGEEGAKEKLSEFISHALGNYHAYRDFPEKIGVSRLSPHIHFGEINIEELYNCINSLQEADNCNISAIERFLSQLGWREFSYHLLYHFPQLPHKNFKKEFEIFPWGNDPNLLKLWQTGQTGYPIIDAGMRELWQTGYMHNRVRMITASFLTKNLFIDWRCGADWFLDTLLDADLANNSMSWQWVAGSGCDSAPYFRIFNPVLQSNKFDPQGAYIRKWLPELAKVKAEHIHAPWQASSADLGIEIGKDYPAPIVNHEESRKKALHYYKELKNL